MQVGNVPLGLFKAKEKMEITITISEEELKLPVDRIFNLCGNRGILAIAKKEQGK